MKLATFVNSQDCICFGVVDGQTLLRLDTFPDAAPDLKTLLPDIVEGRLPDVTGAERVAIDSVKLLPPVTDPSRVLCVATNFHEPGPKKPTPAFPLIFTRFASSITGHGTALKKPQATSKFDFEGELAVVIGKPGFRIARNNAMRYVAGYSCFNDGSVRDWQRHSTQFTPGKNFYQTAGFGPWIVTADEMDDPYASTLSTRVNGEIKQTISLDRMIFDISWLIEYISTFTPLSPGDLIMTGTPSGFGSSRTPPEFLNDGDRVDVTITGLGTLSNTIETAEDPRKLSFSENL